MLIKRYQLEEYEELIQENAQILKENKVLN
jgi:hypothetical protein